MTTPSRRSIILRKRPEGTPQLDNFSLAEDAIPIPGDGEVLTRTLWLSLDPGMRVRMNEAKTYAARIELNAPMTGETVGQVMQSNDARFAPGDIVVGARGWQSHIVSRGDALLALPVGAPYSAYLGILGMPGATAYAGLRDIGQPKPGETVLVSAAAGGVGSVAGQLAKRAGARVVGVAGGADKSHFVRDELGFDDCIDYHNVSDLSAALREACPTGIDVYFENVGGVLQQAVFPQLNMFGRVIMCGMATEYNNAQTQPGPNLGNTFLKRLRIQGFIVGDRPENYPEWRALAAPLIADGSLRYREHVVDGLENAPAAFIDLLTGRNFGKVVVRVGDLESVA